MVKANVELPTDNNVMLLTFCYLIFLFFLCLFSAFLSRLHVGLRIVFASYLACPMDELDYRHMSLLDARHCHEGAGQSTGKTDLFPASSTSKKTDLAFINCLMFLSRVLMP